MLHSDAHSTGRVRQSTVTLDALIPADHPIRAVDAAIDWERHAAPLRACYDPARGRPAFEPDVLLAIALLRQIYHIDSARTAAAEIQINLAYRWFVGCPLEENVPHFSTVSANLLHRFPQDLFEKAFAGAVCDVLDAGVLKPEALLYPSPFLTEEGMLPVLCSRYFVAVGQLPLGGDEPSDDAPSDDASPSQLHLSRGEGEAP